MDHPDTGLKLGALVGLVLVVFSLAGSAQQTGTEAAASSDGFDLDSLVERVSNSKSLGFFTKISLKQDIDRLLGSIRDYHGGSGEGSLEQARERYDAMVHKLIILLQDKDGELAKSIDEGREKLWAILSDEKKFAAI